MSELPAVSVIGGKLYFNTGDSGIKEAVIRSYSDFEFFCNYFLPDVFTEPFTVQRKLVAEILDSRLYPYFSVCSWRNFGKTTFMWAYAMRELLFQRRRFVLYIASTESQAIQQTEDLKIELLLNERIKEIFGCIRQDVVEEKIKFGFSRRFYYLISPVEGRPFGVVVPKGAGQAIRGMNVLVNRKKVRPDLILVDDLETDDVARNEEQLMNIHKWFYSAIRFLTEKRRAGIDEYEGCRKWKDVKESLYQIVVMDTMKNDNALIDKLSQDPEWKSLVLPLAEEVDGELRSCVPELFSDEDVRREYELSDANGTRDIFCREMLCRTSSDENTRFSKDDFLYYSGDEHNSKFVYRFLVVDPARSISTTSSYTGALIFGVNPYENKIYIMDYKLEKMTIEKLENYIVECIFRYRLDALCVEDIGLKDWIRTWLENMLHKRNIGVKIIWLGTTRLKNRNMFNNTKAARLATILPMYKNRQVVHNENIRGSVLETQLLSFPNIKIWDLMDCLGYIPYVMESEALFFMPEKSYNVKELEEYDLKFKQGVWRIV